VRSFSSALARDDGSGTDLVACVFGAPNTSCTRTFGHRLRDTQPAVQETHRAHAKRRSLIPPESERAQQTNKRVVRLRYLVRDRLDGLRVEEGCFPTNDRWELHARGRVVKDETVAHRGIEHEAKNDNGLAYPRAVLVPHPQGDTVRVTDDNVHFKVPLASTVPSACHFAVCPVSTFATAATPSPT
jgi:hypothetical protein